MTRRFNFYRLQHNEDGASLVEFALVLMPLCILLFGSLEVGYRFYAQSVINGSLREAARMASTGQYTAAQIDTHVKSRILDFRGDSNPQVQVKSYRDFTGVGVSEPITSGTVDSGTYCYDDINNNSSWDEDRGATGLGSAEDVVYYQVNMSYPTLFDFSSKVLGRGNTVSLSANTLVSNEPYAAANTSTPTNRCVAA